ncbi:hypothetical protein ES703_33360 [subsurface metagenome]
MSKAKDIARARAEGPFRNQPDDDKRMLCQVDGCSKAFFPRPNEPQICPECAIFLEKLAWFLPRIKVGPAQTEGRLVLPGQPGFGVPSEDALKKEIEKRR